MRSLLGNPGAASCPYELSAQELSAPAVRTPVGSHTSCPYQLSSHQLFYPAVRTPADPHTSRPPDPNTTRHLSDNYDYPELQPDLDEAVGGDDYGDDYDDDHDGDCSTNS
jgi:hypothetical protein